MDREGVGQATAEVGYAGRTAHSHMSQAREQKLKNRLVFPAFC